MYIGPSEAREKSTITDTSAAASITAKKISNVIDTPC